MIKISKSIIAMLAVSTLLIGISGCRKQGPAEKLGEKIDQKADQAGKKLDAAADKTGREIEKVGKKMQY